MNRVLFFLCLCLLLIHAGFLAAQMDTTLDLNQRFYNDAGELLAKGGVEKEGLCIEYLDKNGQPASQEKHDQLRYIEYQSGKPVGKVYYYQKGNLVKVEEYESFNPTIRTATNMRFQSGKISSLRYIAGDTLIEQSFHGNGMVANQTIRVMSQMEYTFYDYRLFDPNGKERFVRYINSDLDTSFYLDIRANGSIGLKETYGHGEYERIEEDKSGNKLLREYLCKGCDSILREEYKKGELDKILKTSAGTPHISNENWHRIITTEGQEGAQQVTRNTYTQKSEKNHHAHIQQVHSLTQEERVTWEAKMHYFQRYSAQGVLLSEGLSSGGVLVGQYIEYHPNGKAKQSGYYDRQGSKTGVWCEYDLQGIVIRKVVF